MGSDQDHKCELEPACLARADLYVPDRQSQTKKLGELRSAIAANHVADTKIFPELGDIIAGKAAGRQSAEQITIADLTGTGLQDTVIAALRANAPKNSSGDRFLGVEPMIAPVLHFSRAEFEQRIKITRQEMEARGLSLLILSDPSNMNWLTGYDGWSFYVHQCVILGLHGDPIGFGRARW